jgi:hypothetical protein
MIMAKEIPAGADIAPLSLYSELSQPDREAAIQSCRNLTNTIYEGLDLTREILAVAHQKLGETVLILEGSHVAAFAVCHTGKGSEGGSGTCLIKFAAARPGISAEGSFEKLILACEGFAHSRNVPVVHAGVNSARHEAYRQLAGSGYRAFLHGVAMHRGNDAGYNRPGVFVIDDWR